MTYQEMALALKEKSDRISAIFALQEKEGAAGTARDATEAEKAELKKLNDECVELTKKLEDTQEGDSIRKQNDARKAFLGAPIEDVPVPGDPSRRKSMTVGEMVLNDDAFKAWLDSVSFKAGNDGRAVKQAKFGQSPSVDVNGVDYKTLLTGLSSTSAGAMVVNDRKPIIDLAGYLQPLGILDVVGKGTTDSDLVEYVRMTANTNAAAETLEATATGDGSGAFAESAWTLAVVQENVQSVGHWIPATRRALADAGQTRTLIDSMLLYGLKARLESQMLNGSGTSPDFTGIKNVSGCLTQSFSNNLLESVRKGKTKVMKSAVSSGGGAIPTAIIMNPADWETVELAQDNDARYFGAGPFGVTAPRLWGVPVVISEFQASGYALIGQFDLAMYWDRKQASIYVSDSHSDFFVRNLIAFLAEIRGAFGVIRPAAFCHVDIAA